MGDTLQGVLNGVSEVIHGIDAPLVAGAVVRHVLDAVDGRVAHIEVAAGQVDLGAEGHSAIGELTGPHPSEQIQALLNGAIPIRAGGGGVDVAPMSGHLLRRQLTDVGQPLPDQLHSVVVHLFEVVRRIVEPILPVIAQPLDVLLDGVHVLHIFLGGVGVIHAQVAQAVILLGGAEVYKDGLGVTDVEIAVGFRRESSMHLQTGVGAVFRDVLVDEVMNKVLCHDDVVISHKIHSPR